MNPVYLFNLAGQHAQWASVRQATITGNIANANTGGYSALDIQPFAATLNEMAGATMARTEAGHIVAGGRAGAGDEAASFAIEDSGAPVKLDQELIKADEASRAFSLDTAIMRAFHRMLLSSLRSGA